jgi:hypothetical protein
VTLIRQYIEHVSSIHESFRATIKQLEVDSEQFLRELLARYVEKEKTPQARLMGVAVGFENPDETITGAEYLVEHRLRACVD